MAILKLHGDDTSRSHISLTRHGATPWSQASLPMRLSPNKLELVNEVKRYDLDIDKVTSTHSLGSGTNSLEKRWALFHSGEWHQGGLVYSEPPSLDSTC